MTNNKRKIGKISYTLKANPQDHDVYNFEAIDSFYQLYQKHQSKLKTKSQSTLAQLYKVIYREYDPVRYGFLYNQLSKKTAPIHKFLKQEGFDIEEREWNDKKLIVVIKTEKASVSLDHCDISKGVLERLTKALGANTDFNTAALGTLCREFGFKGKEKAVLKDHLTADESPIISALAKMDLEVTKKVNSNQQLYVWVTKKGCESGNRWGQLYRDHKAALALYELYETYKDYGKACFKFSHDYDTDVIPCSEKDLISGLWKEKHPHPRDAMGSYRFLGVSNAT